MFNSTVFASEGVCVCLASHRASWPGNAHARTIWIRVKMYCFTSLISRTRAHAMRLSMLAPELYISYTYVRMCALGSEWLGFLLFVVLPIQRLACAAHRRSATSRRAGNLRYGSVRWPQDETLLYTHSKCAWSQTIIPYPKKNTVQLQLKPPAYCHNYHFCMNWKVVRRSTTNDWTVLIVDKQ